MQQPFHSIYTHGFIRAAVCIPFLRVADSAFNVEWTIGLARRASQQHAAVALFPELGLSAYANDDLLQQESTTDLAWDGHALICENNDLLAEAERFSADEQLITADIDIQGEMRQEEKKGERYHLRECRFGQFQRALTLPTNIQANQVSCEFRDGTLRLTLPKAEEARPRRIPISGGEQPKQIGGQAREVGGKT